MFKLHSDYKPTGDQPHAIDSLVSGIEKGEDHQVLLGTTGSGKTFSVANVVEEVQKPTLVISHNKTLAAQLYQEFRDFFPENAVEYFVSYYDYYQPESYIPQTDTYIEKDADINEQIDKLRLSATTSLMTREDVIIVASVSCIYNLGSPAEYSKVALKLKEGMKIRKMDLFKRLNQLHYDRNEFDFMRGTYRVRGDVVDIYPAYQDFAVRVELFEQKLVNLSYFDPVSGKILKDANFPEKRQGNRSQSLTQLEKEYTKRKRLHSDKAVIYPAKHYITAEDKRDDAIKQIEKDLEKRLKELQAQGKKIEAHRLKQRTLYDLEMIEEIGYCKGIENYSRYFDGREPGGTPYTLMDFFPDDYMLVIDESHMTIPQVRGMHNGDHARKKNLIEHGFRLPSAFDNRPLNFEEFKQKMGQTIYTSATPSNWEIEKAGEENVVEQLIRPTGIPDPKITVKPTKNQVEDLLKRVREKVDKGQRVLVTTLTKRMAEELASYLHERNLKVTYLHSDIETLERSNILDDLRRGNYDVLVGINLLREGLDLPEVSLVAILDADKEGFLRSETSLIQTMGRAARHIEGEVVMYADNITNSMKKAIDEVERRREIQIEYNKEHDIEPKQIVKPIRKKLIDEIIEEEIEENEDDKDLIDPAEYSQLPPDELEQEIDRLTEMMKYEAEMLNFERAAVLRDKVRDIKDYLK